jgi:hypothetical protein
MKKHSAILGLLLASRAFAAENDAPDLNQCKDRLTLSARFGFNVSAKFAPRLTPDGLAYNYLDGYVLRDSTGDFDPTGTFPGVTQNWGYDNSTRQRDGSAPVGGFPTVSMTRLASGADPFTDKFDDDPSLGFELVYARRLCVRDQWHFGVEAAVNFTSIGISESGTTSGSGVRDAYQYFPGTSPPNSPNANGEPYQGRFDQAGIVISDTPASSTPVPVSVAAQRKFDADLWGFRLGPYVERQLSRRWAVNLAGGLAVAIVDGNASWSQTLTVSGVTDPTYSGHAKDCDVLWGWYVGGNITWHMDRRWDVTGGVQYQDVGIYRQNVGARRAELDLGQSIFVSIGISRRF